MRLTTSQVTKLLISDLPDHGDSISVMVEDFAPGVGKITITSAGEAWSNYWGSMSEQHTMRSFFSKCSAAYLVGKLSCGIRSMIPDDDNDALMNSLCKEIIKKRRDRDIDRNKARELWDEVRWVTFGEHRDIFEQVFGGEWWEEMPKKPNPDYENLLSIVKTVQKAFALEKSMQAQALKEKETSV